MNENKFNETRPVQSTDDFEGLASDERENLKNCVQSAYYDANLGYGDEGEGYDMDVFIKNMLEMGWVFNGFPDEDQQPAYSGD